MIKNRDHLLCTFTGLSLFMAAALTVPSASALAQPVADVANNTNYGTAYGSWQVSEVRGGDETGLEIPFCSMSNYFSNDLLLVMTKNADQSGSIAFDFNTNSLELDREYQIELTIGENVSHSYKAYPGNRQALVLQLDRADELFMPMAKYATLSARISNQNYDFDLGRFIDGLNNLNGCLSALTGTPIAVISPSELRPATGEEGKLTPLASSQPYDANDGPHMDVAYVQKLPSARKDMDNAVAIDSDDVSSTTQPSDRTTNMTVKSAETDKSFGNERPTLLVTSNAADLGIDLSALFKSDIKDKGSMKDTSEEEVSEDISSISEPDSIQQPAMPEALMRASMADEMPAAGDGGSSIGSGSSESMTTEYKQEETAAVSQSNIIPEAQETEQKIVVKTNKRSKRKVETILMVADEKQSQQISSKQDTPKPMPTAMPVSGSAQLKPMMPEYNNQEYTNKNDYGMGQPTSVADLGGGEDALSLTSSIPPEIYAKLKEKYRSAIYERRGVNVPLKQAIEQISPKGFDVVVSENVNADTLVSWHGGRPWRVLLDDLLEPLGYSAVIKDKQITLATKKETKP